MDEAPNSDMNIDYHGTQGLLSTMPMHIGFNIDEDIGISELFKLLQEDPMNIAPSTSKENVALNHQHSDISELPSLNFQEDHETQGLLSTMPLNSELNIDEDIDILELFKLLQEDPMNIVPSTSIENAAPNHQHSDISESPSLNFQEQPPSISIENVASNDPNPDMSQLPNDFFLKEKPLTTNTIPSSSSTEEGDKNSSSRTTYQNTLDKDDNYSLFYIYSMGVTMLRQEGGRRKEDPIPIEGDINISSRREQDNSRTNAMILQQPMLKIPVLEKLEKESMKQKLTVDHPLVISTNTRKEKENSQTNDLMILKPPISRTPCLENLETDSMKPKFTIDDHSFGSSTRREQENPRTNAMILSPPIPKSPMLIEKESDFMKSKLTIDSQFGISTSRRVGEQENPKNNGLILQQLVSNIPILEKFEREFNKPKLTFDHPFGTSTSKKVEVKENLKTDGLMLQQQPMPNIPTLEKLESDLMKRKTMPGHTIARKDEQRIESGGFKSTDNSSTKEDEIHTGVVNSLDIELQQKTSSNGGPIRRLPNKTSSRYQPFGGQTPNKQGSNRHVLYLLLFKLASLFIVDSWKFLKTV
ncbi:uncharacterized protein LOC132601669 [Lycium barbarum]|uniref:uncharacterized protein LOC132601669 n=1 Tax=Lycium barbarum TaxID=112863 RepID=UPI00293E3319|nr:uncharacterized protein LOC132601669 [Lycium barbarum]